MKKIISSIIVGIFLCSSISLAGHPKKYKQRNNNKLDTGDNKKNNDDHILISELKDTLKDYFGHKKDFLESEYINQYSVYLSLPESKYWRWLATLSVNLVSKDLYSLLFLFSRDEAINELEKWPNGTGIFRATYHEKGSIAITYKENDEIKHALLDISALHNYSLRNVIFCSKLSFLQNILVLGYDENNQQKILPMLKSLLEYPVDTQLVKQIN